MQRITVTLDDELMEELDRVMVAKGYQNRSEALRDLTRAGMKQSALDAGATGECVGVLSYVYDHGARELAKRLTSTFHDHHGLTISSLHVHLDHHNCLEVSILKGAVPAVQHVADHVIAERAVRHGQLAIIPAPDKNLSEADAKTGHDHDR
ncbi:putative nickel-responsive regulator [Devosia pacifica]|uniref:Putative nickel-responsive regulator n=1 Tax=Devosia pacifica TaxID=1335967 RepID=A0A918VWI1_9HYPH|nr:nickel-responsive transcriptional regulator NikR [Devosia pacifica]GHA30106.1 putative nickel-responsive regulator [Devosia pacifica]